VEVSQSWSKFVVDVLSAFEEQDSAAGRLIWARARRSPFSIVGVARDDGSGSEILGSPHVEVHLQRMVKPSVVRSVTRAVSLERRGLGQYALRSLANMTFFALLLRARRKFRVARFRARGD
jgi:hypothetical protein